MLRKSGVIVILLLVLLSLTVGSVSPANVVSGNSGSAVIKGYKVLGFMPPMVYSYGEPIGMAGFTHTVNKFTTVTLDMSGQGVVTTEYTGWHPTENSGPHVVLIKSMLSERRDYIAGRMIVQMAGSDMPQAFPVKFIKHTEAGAVTAGRPSFDSYMADMAFMMDSGEHGNSRGLMMCPLDGIPGDGPEGAFFTFSGEINVPRPDMQLNGIIIDANNDTSSPLYDNTITQGQTVYHQAQVAGGNMSMSFDLKWNDADDDLRLSVYTPDGHVLGPYTDDSDGAADGRINLEVDNPAGVSGGAWSFKVTGTDVTGKDEYYLRTW